MSTNISPAKLHLLRKTLGLGFFTKLAKQNWLPPAEAAAYPLELAELVADGLMVADQGSEGVTYHATPEGKRIAFANQEKDIDGPTSQTDPLTRNSAMSKTPPATELVTAPAPTEVGALALITLDPAQYVAQVFAPFRSKLDMLKAESALVHFEDNQMRDEGHTVIDISTVKGMDVALKWRAAFRDDVRIAAEKARVDRKKPILEIGRLLDSTFKQINEEVMPFELRFDTAIREENSRKEATKAAKEKAEAERVAAIRAKIADIASLPAKNAGSNSTTMHAVLSMLAARPIMDDEFFELTDAARTAVDVAGRELEGMYGNAKIREQDEADRLAAIEDQRVAMAAQAEANRVEAARLEQVAAAARAAEEERIRIAAAGEAERKRLAAIEQARIDGIAEEARGQLAASQAAAIAESNRLAAASAELEAKMASFAQQQAAASRATVAHAAEVVAEVTHQAAPGPDPAHELRAMIEGMQQATDLEPLRMALMGLLETLTPCEVRALVEVELTALAGGVA